jgi:hypothetical protein
LFLFQVTCRNRADGKTYSCCHCSKTFPTKRHLHEHSKRKHNEGIDSSPAKKTEDQQQVPEQVSQQHQQPSQPPRLPSILPHLKQEQQHHHQEPLQQHPGYYPNSIASAYQQQQPPSFYPHPPPQYDQYLMTSVVTGSDLALPQIPETTAAESLPKEEEDEAENVGSLMRLVYSCSDSNSSPSPSSSSSSSASSSSSFVNGRMQPNYSERHPHVHQVHLYHHHSDKVQHQPHHPHHHHQQQQQQHSDQQLVSDYPILEGLPIDCL